jgi:hypothetical protein
VVTFQYTDAKPLFGGPGYQGTSTVTVGGATEVGLALRLGFDTRL